MSFFVFVAGYVFFGIFVTLNQEKFIYLPPKESFFACEALGEYATQTGTTRMYHKDSGSDTVIVYYHGNNTDACDQSFMTEIFDQQGVSYIFPEYTGYGQDGMKTSKDGIVSNVQDIVTFVEGRYKKVIIIGRSLGTGMAAYHASIGRVDNILLISPFKTLQDAAQQKYQIYPTRFLLRDDYDSAKNLKNYTNPISVVIVGEDEIVPIESSMALFNTLNSKDKRMYEIPGLGHYEIYTSPIFIEFFVDYIKNVTL